MNKIIYLDAAASSLKPESVISAEVDFLHNKYANAGRGICARAAAVDDMVAHARERVARFMNASAHQIVFTSGTTDGMNRITNILTSRATGRAPVVAVSDLDHHSARMPWEVVARTGRAQITVCPLDKDFNIDTARIPSADIIVITAMSNVIGVPQDVAKIVRSAREKNPNVISVVDAAQYVAHAPIDAAAWDADFICFSGHKIGADTGVGIMYVKNPDDFAPDKTGGGMVGKITGVGEWTLMDAPEKFEAGTLPLTQIAGLEPAIDELEKSRPDLNLIKYMYDELARLPRVRLITNRDAALLTFVVDGMHALDFGALIGARGVCLRVGNMCATWIHRVIGVAGTIRISVGSWNTMDEMRAVVGMIKEIVK